MDRLMKTMKVIRMLIPAVLLSTFLYILLHEFGHVFVLWTVGADITEFSILSAHVSYIGGEWTNLSDRWMHVNGAFFPLVVSFIYMLFYKKSIANMFYRVFSAFFVLMPLFSLLAWVVIPFFYVSGQVPDNDDIYKFLYNFTADYPAYFVTVVSLIFIICFISIAMKKGIVSNFIETIRKIKSEASE